MVEMRGPLVYENLRSALDEVPFLAAGELLEDQVHALYKIIPELREVESCPSSTYVRVL